MYEIEKTEKINQLITITKSNSGIVGPDLAKVHIELGMLLGKQMTQFHSNDTTIVAIMRGGIFFAEGLYFQLGCRFQTYDPKKDTFIKPQTKNVILVDSVINTGKTMKTLFKKDMFVACCVINETRYLTYHSEVHSLSGRPQDIK